MPDITLPEITLPSIPGLSGFASMGGGAVGGFTSLFSISSTAFPMTSIKPNPDLLDLLETIRNDTISFVKGQADFKQGLLGDVAGVDGSLTDNVNPRSLTPKRDTLSNGAPYKQLGILKYTDYIFVQNFLDVVFLYVHQIFRIVL